jgi:hypothetical protein
MPGVKHYTVFNATTSRVNGTYNHGPIITRWSGSFVLSWYNGPQDEGRINRVLLATSPDAKQWSAPVEVFPALSSDGEQTEPWALVDDRLYAAASTVGWGNAHDSGIRGGLLMRRVLGLGPVSFGPIFWLGDVPSGLEQYGFKTSGQMDKQVYACTGTGITRVKTLTAKMARCIDTIGCRNNHTQHGQRDTARRYHSGCKRA